MRGSRKEELQAYMYFGVAEGFYLLLISKVPCFWGSSGAAGILLATVLLCIGHRLWGVTGKKGESNPLPVPLTVLYLLFLAMVFAAVLVTLSILTADWVLEGMDWRFVLAMLAFFLLLGVGRRSRVWRRLLYISWKWLAVILAGLLLPAIRQVNPAHASDFLQFDWRAAGIACGLYLLFCWPSLLLPGPAGNTMWPDGKEAWYLALGIVQTAASVLLSFVYGGRGMMYRKWPVISLLQGLSLPGKFLERLDVFWVAVFLYAGLLALGLLLGKMGAVLEAAGVPVMNDDFRRVKDGIALLILAVSLILYGYHCVEARDRAYALALCADWRDGQYIIWFVETLPESGNGSPGQQSSSEGSTEEEKTTQEQAGGYAGESLAKIRELFSRSSNRLLDLGHVQAVVFSQALLADEEAADALFAEFAAMWQMDENSYVYQSEDVRALAEADLGGDSLGDYLTGLYENQTGRKGGELLLRELLVNRENEGEEPEIPEVSLNGGKPFLNS